MDKENIMKELTKLPVYFIPYHLDAIASWHISEVKKAVREYVNKIEIHEWKKYLLGAVKDKVCYIKDLEQIKKEVLQDLENNDG